MSKTKRFNKAQNGRKRFKMSKKAILTTVIVVLSVVLLVGASVLIFKPSETKTISASAFSRGGINKLGNPVKSDKSIYTSKMFECSGLKVEPLEDAELEYEVFYYDSDKNYMRSTGVMTGVYENDYPFAKYARIVVTPTGKETKEDKFKIGIFDVRSYADKLVITVDAKQGSIWKEVEVPVKAQNSLNDCIYTGEYWITVGENGHLAYSTDCDKWSVLETEFDTLTSVAFGGGKYVVVDNKSGIHTASNMYDEWTNTLEAEGLYKVVYANGNFVAVGSNGVVYTSNDGISWSSVEKFTDSKLNDVAYIKEQYVVVGVSGRIFVSDDLETWYNKSTSLIKNIHSIYHDGINYFISGDDGVILMSSNLSSWVDVVVTSSSQVEYVSDVATHDGSLFAAVSTSKPDGGEIWISEDSGFTWNVILTSDEKLWIAEDGDNKLLIGGENGKIYILE